MKYFNDRFISLIIYFNNYIINKYNKIICLVNDSILQFKKKKIKMLDFALLLF